ncbi:MAG: valine--tRNA ligase [Gammaproteobacteria bacterium]|nr:valine--tRNA ligase [Gammaproteobacteria bacterium]MDH3806382.1 valine--tRNA ligase [Gammaproteobacteria bacterium]
MNKSYQPKNIEQRVYARWEERGYFAPQGSGEPYCIMIPPPNVTGTLHMGHAFQDTIMDALIRYKRMQGCKVLWQPGTDHAGIATQMVVERILNSEGSGKRDIGREKFVDRVWQWKEESGGQIGNQLRRLGASLDWSRDRFTMDDSLSHAVRKEFVDLYDEGLIYRGKRLVNWDPVLHTALSDLEVLSADEDGHLWHFRYPLASGDGHLVVATTRPETMLGDSAVAVHPKDDRYKDLIGKEIVLPIVGRRIPIIADDYVDVEFGTGCVKITPAHDFNDYDIGKRHNLPVYNILTDDAALNEEVPKAYRGMDRFDARKAIVAEFKKLKLLDKVEDYVVKIPRGDRSGAVVEPYLTDQWYVKIEPLAKPAIEAVESGKIRFVPENWSKTYFDWMYNIQDWCISRQLWWGHRIPAWYDNDGNVYVGYSEEDVRKKHSLGDDLALRQDEDVLDTWFSSALWPFSTLGWPEKTDALAAFYPGNVLVTGFDIIFFWVARMIMMGIKLMGDVPFHEVYIHGLIRDQDGQKMSKSKGNVLDPIDLIDGVDLDTLLAKRLTGLMQDHLKPKIEKATRKQFPNGIEAYGCDALRFTFAALATTGRDIRFDLGRIEGNKNFCNKIWNAARYVLMNTEEIGAGDIELTSADLWIMARLDHTVATVHENFAAYRLDLAAQAIYEFTWHEFCDWYLELSKPVLQSDEASDALKLGTQRTLVDVLESLLRLLHPLMPFISEEIWQQVAPRAGIDAETIMLQPYPQVSSTADYGDAVADIDWVRQFILGIRQIRGEMDISPGKPLPVILQNSASSDRQRAKTYANLLQRVGRVESVTVLDSDEASPAAATALLGDLRLLVPMKGVIDIDAERARLEKQQQRLSADLARTRGKLDNVNFVNNAPADVVTKERQRAVEFEKKVVQLGEQLEKLAELT